MIEVDGEQHGLTRGQARDRRRDALLGEAGFAVLRFWNHAIDRTLDDVAEAIDREATARLTPSVALRHLPLTGEG